MLELRSAALRNGAQRKNCLRIGLLVVLLVFGWRCFGCFGITFFCIGGQFVAGAIVDCSLRQMVISH